MEKDDARDACNEHGLLRRLDLRITIGGGRLAADALELAGGARDRCSHAQV